MKCINASFFFGFLYCIIYSIKDACFLWSLNPRSFNIRPHLLFLILYCICFLGTTFILRMHSYFCSDPSLFYLCFYFFLSLCFPFSTVPLYICSSFNFFCFLNQLFLLFFLAFAFACAYCMYLSSVGMMT